ncbi:hypothetical protein, partial [Corynebacterium flavescens]|uniref:hypothetical protein n=1 Tax=Corynebacterium flavescens TaxID=28028 RepID=UPI003FCF6CAF
YGVSYRDLEEMMTSAGRAGRLDGCALGIEVACLPQCTGKRHGFMDFVFADHHVRSLACRG